ncbi:MAG: metallophosphoesterase [Verrucomicrobiota bacterium]
MVVPNLLRIAATGDLHYTKHSRGAQQRLLREASRNADVLLLCGDLTEYGLPQEAEVLAEDLRTHAHIPVVAVLGNHDFESGHMQEIRSIIEKAGAITLDGECIEIEGVGFAGVPGFGGGFGRRMLNAWGEPMIKSFVQEAIDHAMRLEQALARIHSTQRIVLLHYSPIRSTVEGENLEILPFLGSSRLEGPLNRFSVTAAFHGHAHNGAPIGETGTKVPVFNVAIPVLQRLHPDQPPFRLFEVQLREETTEIAAFEAMRAE